MHRVIEKMRAQREQGFTLVELLVVILIIGILAAVAIPMFMNQRSSAVESTLKSDLRNAGTLLQGQKQFTGSLATDTKMSEGIQLVAMRKADRHNYLKVSQFEDGATTSWGLFVYSSDSTNYSTKLFVNPTDGYKGMNYRRITLNAGYNRQIGHHAGFALPEVGKKGDKYTMGVAIRSNVSKCLNLNMEFKNGESWPGGIDTTNVCVAANEWQYFTAHGEMSGSGSTRVVFSAYAPLYAGENLDVTGAVMVKGDQINAEEALSKTGYDYCIQGYHQDYPTNIWRYSNLDGGVAEGRC